MKTAVISIRQNLALQIMCGPYAFVKILSRQTFVPYAVPACCIAAELLIFL